MNDAYLLLWGAFVVTTWTAFVNVNPPLLSMILKIVSLATAVLMAGAGLVQLGVF